MSGKLDQSLDDIVKTTRGPRVGGRRRGAAVKTKAVVNPSGGISKKTAVKAGKGSKAAVVAAASVTRTIAATGESKIVVSGLPSDVSEQQIKEYFAKTVGPVKKALLTYGPNGQSRGIATIIFEKPESASKAAKELNGVKVDNRAMKIEVVLGAKQAPTVVAKTLADRVAKPKAGTKGAAKIAVKPATNGTKANGAAATKGRGRGGRKTGRPAARPKKTAEDLDMEMATYFGAGAEANGAANGAAPATTGDTEMTAL